MSHHVNVCPFDYVHDQCKCPGPKVVNRIECPTGGVHGESWLRWDNDRRVSYREALEPVTPPVTEAPANRLSLDTALELVNRIEKANAILRPLAAMQMVLGASSLNVEIALDNLNEAQKTIAALGRRKD